jgi:cytochrome b pre-mRNA-processing protein 3
MFGLFRENPRKALITGFYARVAAASRAPELYLEAGMPDTVEGRLESLTLHGLLAMRRLGALPPPGAEVAQEFTDTLFRHVDHGLRELGVGDVTVPKRMKAIARNFYGRVGAYAPALDAADAGALAAALERNIPGVDGAKLAAYALGAEQALAGFDLDQLLSDMQPFPALAVIGQTPQEV